MSRQVGALEANLNDANARLSVLELFAAGDTGDQGAGPISQTLLGEGAERHRDSPGEGTFQVSDCSHPDFKAEVTVNRLIDSGLFTADVKINCVVCGQPFRFVGLEMGSRFDRPTISANGEELRAPVEPSDGKIQGTSATFQMPQMPRRNQN